jgi:anti-sigma factor RsiW
MTQGDRPIGEEELHAYLDGALEPARRLAIALYLADHPEEAARLEAFRAQKEVFRLLFDRALDQPVPARLLRVIRRGSARALLRRYTWAFICGGAIGGLVIGGQALSDRLAAPRDGLISVPPPQGPHDSGYPVLPPAPRQPPRSVDI